MTMSWWALWVIDIVKIVYALYWFCKPTRYRYVKYFRLSMTAGLSGFFNTIVYGLLAIQVHDDD